MTSTLHASFIIEKWTIYSEDFILIFVSNACTLYRIQILQLYQVKGCKTKLDKAQSKLSLF